MTKLPPHGICVPCRIRKIVDGDTIDVSTDWSTIIWRIRLLDCWVADKTEEDRQARLEISKLVTKAEAGLGCSVWIPIKQGEEKISELLTLDRVLGKVFAGETDIGDYLVGLELATRTKPKDRKPRSLGD